MIDRTISLGIAVAAGLAALGSIAPAELGKKLESGVAHSRQSFRAVALPRQEIAIDAAFNRNN